MSAHTNNILTVDVEEWFQVENYAGLITRDTWPGRQSRVAASVERLLGLFEEAGVRATFFVLGWVAERLPDLVPRIAAGGHEIASHGWTHTPIWNLGREEFREEVTRSRALLEAQSGRPVVGYRAPTFSVTARTLWALQELARAGYRYDSSIFPVRHDRYGIPDAPTAIHLREEGLWEIPLSVYPLGRFHLPVAGGGYLRLFPHSLTRRAIERLNRREEPAVVYVHPWEFDPGQPRVPGVGLLRTWRHHVGIGRNLGKLARLLGEFRFAPAGEVLDTLSAAGRVGQRAAAAGGER